MSKRGKKILGIYLIILGLAVIFAKPLGITGAVVDLSAIKDVWFYVIGALFIVTGIILETENLEYKVMEDTKKTIAQKKTIPDYYAKRTKEIFDSKYNGQDVWISRGELDGIMDYIKYARDGRGNLLYPKNIFEHGSNTPTIHLPGEPKTMSYAKREQIEKHGAKIPGGVPRNILHMQTYVRNNYNEDIKRHLFITDNPKDPRLKTVGISTFGEKAKRISSKVYTPNHPSYRKQVYKRAIDIS